MCSIVFKIYLSIFQTTKNSLLRKLNQMDIVLTAFLAHIIGPYTCLKFTNMSFTKE
jgi:hypothetical protein